MTSPARQEYICVAYFNKAVDLYTAAWDRQGNGAYLMSTFEKRKETSIESITYFDITGKRHLVAGSQIRIEGDRVIVVCQYVVCQPETLQSKRPPPGFEHRPPPLIIPTTPTTPPTQHKIMGRSHSLGEMSKTSNSGSVEVKSSTSAEEKRHSDQPLHDFEVGCKCSHGSCAMTNIADWAALKYVGRCVRHGCTSTATFAGKQVFWKVIVCECNPKLPQHTHTVPMFYCSAECQRIWEA